MLKPLNGDVFEILLQYAFVAAFCIVLLMLLIVLIERVWTQAIYPSLCLMRHPSEAKDDSDDECATNESEEDDHGDYIS